VIIAAAIPLGAQSADPSILIGANSIEYAGGSPPNCFGPSVLYDYGQSAARHRVQAQLAAMAASGLDSLRVFFVFDYDVSENQYFVPARTGQLEEPFKSNLINYLRDIKAAGFRRVTLAFDPRYSADPGHRFGPYDPTTFEASWGLIRDTQPLLKQYGPSDSRVDLLNEGAPFLPGPDARIDWVQKAYGRYVDAFGANDVTVSAAIGSSVSGLVQVLQGTGKPLPKWFDLHPRYEYTTSLDDLRRWDAELTTAGATQQTLVIGEVKYNDPDAARAVAEFAQEAQHHVEEVMEFPAITNGVGGQSQCIDPPYRIDAYALALRGSAPLIRLTATISDKATTLVTASGRRVTALESGKYTIVVNDNSRKRGITLNGPGVRRSTTARYRGRTSWRATFSPGTYTYGSQSFDVLTDR